MIRIISFRGTAAKVVITYRSITGEIRIPFYLSLLLQSLPKINFFKWGICNSAYMAVLTYVCTFGIEVVIL